MLRSKCVLISHLTQNSVGGHSGATIVPLLSQTTEGAKIVKEGGEKLAALVKRIQYGGDEVVAAKDGAGSATLSMAYGMHYLMIQRRFFFTS